MAPQAKAKPIKFEPSEYAVVLSQAEADRCGVKAGDVFEGAKVIVAEPFEGKWLVTSKEQGLFVHEVLHGSPQ